MKHLYMLQMVEHNALILSSKFCALLRKSLRKLLRKPPWSSVIVILKCLCIKLQKEEKVNCMY